MNLISCGICGTVLDKDRIPEPYIWKEEGDSEVVDTRFAVWDGDDFVPVIKCPSCKYQILYYTGDEIY